MNKKSSSRNSQKNMIYQEVGCNKPCLERKSIRKEGKQYWQERKREKDQKKTVGSWKLRRNEKEKEEKELEKVDDRPTPVAEKPQQWRWQWWAARHQAVENQLHQLSVPFQDHHHPPHWKYNWKALTITLKSDRTKLKMSLLPTYHFDQVWYELGMNHWEWPLLMDQNQ